MGQDRKDRQGRDADLSDVHELEALAQETEEGADEHVALAIPASRELDTHERQERHDREVAEALHEERRLLRWEILAILIVIVIVIVRQLFWI